MSKKIVIMIIIGFVMFAGMLGGSLIFMMSKISSIDKESANDAKEAVEEVVESETEVAGIGCIYSLETFIVNLADPEANRFLRVTMDLELSDESLVPKLDERLPQIRDSILMVLTSKKLKDINSIEGKISLRDEITAGLSAFFKDGAITRLYYKEFVIQ
ncbi:MAG: flagellar basal body-associated FliL family protein [Thermodesulfobacteriota bacterium]|nr:flagellar basal body-associated FliL family protein [Thermodesulfobacteriota bacterium]